MPRAKTSPPPKKTVAETNGRAVAVNVPLPPDLHRRLRVRCAEQHLTIKAGVIAAIESWVA